MVVFVGVMQAVLLFAHAPFAGLEMWDWGPRVAWPESPPPSFVRICDRRFDRSWDRICDTSVTECVTEMVTEFVTENVTEFVTEFVTENYDRNKLELKPKE